MSDFVTGLTPVATTCPLRLPLPNAGKCALSPEEEYDPFHQ